MKNQHGTWTWLPLGGSAGASVFPVSLLFQLMLTGAKNRGNQCTAYWSMSQQPCEEPAQGSYLQQQAQYTPASSTSLHKCLLNPLLTCCERLQIKCYSIASPARMKLEDPWDNAIALPKSAPHMMRPHSHFCQTRLPLWTFLPWQFFSDTSEKGIWRSTFLWLSDAIISKENPRMGAEGSSVGRVLAWHAPSPVLDSPQHKGHA